MKYRIGDIFACNMTLYKLLNEQRLKISIPNGLKLYHLTKIFDDVENYVFCVMNEAFGEDVDYNSLTEEQKLTYNEIMNTQIELSFDKLDENTFENEQNTLVDIEDINNLLLIFKEDEKMSDKYQ